MGALWDLSEQNQFVHDNVEVALLRADFVALPSCQALWLLFLALEAEAVVALLQASDEIARLMLLGQLPAVGFRAAWEALERTPTVERSGSAADDYLDGLFRLQRLTTGEPRPANGTPNMASRAWQVADLLEVTRPGSGDVLFDLGSGSGKVALTVAASTLAQVHGVEWGEAYVATARASAARFGLRNLRFTHADVREVDLSGGSIFYLYYPFHGAVAEDVARTLGKLARMKEITIYASGPRNEYGEYFLREVRDGALRLSESRGVFSEVMVLRSGRP